MAEQMKDQRDRLLEEFQHRYEAWLDPINHPTTRFRDVEDARQDVVMHQNQLVRAGVIKPGQDKPVQGQT